MASLRTPGVYHEDVVLAPPPVLQTGVPGFLGYVGSDRRNPAKVEMPQLLSAWPEFEQYFGPPRSDGYLGAAVAGFFSNGGSQCYVVPLDLSLAPLEATQHGLASAGVLDTIDLVCAPDVMRDPEPLERDAMQTAVLNHCDLLGDRLAILDAAPGASLDDVRGQRSQLIGTNGALYYPWIKIFDAVSRTTQLVPPSGHVAGVYATADRQVGVHKPPANVALQGVVDLEVNLNDGDQGELNPVGVNCLRAFPGRGIRVWGARTLSRDPAWTYVSVLRMFLTAGRWLERNMRGIAFEPHDQRLWSRVVRQLTAYFDDQFQRGALRGRSPEEAYYVKCDADTNPELIRELGRLVVEIGLAPALPEEFVVVRLIHGPGGVTIAGPQRPGAQV